MAAYFNCIFSYAVLAGACPQTHKANEDLPQQNTTLFPANLGLRSKSVADIVWTRSNLEVCNGKYFMVFVGAAGSRR